MYVTIVSRLGHKIPNRYKGPLFQNCHGVDSLCAYANVNSVFSIYVKCQLCHKTVI